MNHDIDQLLNGLLAPPSQPRSSQPVQQSNTPAPPKRSSASEESLRRVEEIMRSVEQESDRRRAVQPPKKEYPKPQHAPVVVPPPVSHFSEEPSQDTAVRMRDRLDETSLPKIDSDKKPNQIIPPKPKPEPPKKKRRKKKRPEVQPAPPLQQDIPAPAEPPKRKIPHIVIPDELPPDIPRDTSIADEIRRRKLAQQTEEPAVQAVPEPITAPEPQPVPAAKAPAAPKLSVHEKANLIKQRMRQLQEEQPASEELPEETPEPQPVPEELPEPAPAPAVETPAEEEPDEEELTLQERADMIRESIRQMHEELSALPSPEELEASGELEVPEETPEQAPAEEEHVDETPRSRGFGFFRRRKNEEPETEQATEEETVPTDDLADEESAQTDASDEAEELLAETPEEEQTEEKQPEEETSEETAPVLRHLHLPEPEEPAKKGVFGLFSRKKKLKPTTAIAEIAEETAEAPEIPDEEIPEILEEPDTAEAPEEILPSEEATPEPISEPQDAPEPAPSVPEETEEEEPETATESVPEEAAPDEPAPSQETAAPSIDITLPGETDREKKKNAFIAAIHAALDESAQELAEIKAEPIPEQSEIDVALGRPQFWKRYAYFIVGILCTALACVGVAACVVKGKELVQRFASSSSLKSELEERIYPIAVVDLPPFASAAELQNEAALSAAMIDLLMYEDLSGYPCSFDVYSIPAEQVKKHAASMFGPEITLTDTTLHAAGETFYYDTASGCYNVPASPMIFSYSPEVQEVTRSGDVFTVTVIYRGETAKWQQNSGNFSGIGTKTMKITMTLADDEYRITGVVNISDESEGM